MKQRISRFVPSFFQATLAPEELPEPPEHKTLVELRRVVRCVGEEMCVGGLGDALADLEGLRRR